MAYSAFRANGIFTMSDLNEHCAIASCLFRAVDAADDSRVVTSTKYVCVLDRVAVRSLCPSPVSAGYLHFHSTVTPNGRGSRRGKIIENE